MFVLYKKITKNPNTQIFRHDINNIKPVKAYVIKIFETPNIYVYVCSFDFLFFLSSALLE